MIPEDLMRKYKYGYVHSCEMLNEPFVKDLLKENKKLKVLNRRYEEVLSDNEENYKIFSSEINNLKSQ